MSLQIILNNLNYNLIKKNNKYYLVVFNKNYFVKLKINSNTKIYFNKHCKTILLLTTFFTSDIIKSELLINNLSFSLNNYFSCKLSFVGKSYKIKKKNKSFIFEFNKSHVECIIWRNFFLKKIKKNKIFLKNINFNEIKTITSLIILIRKINPFTKRGLRKSKSIIKKKIGKKSA